MTLHQEPYAVRKSSLYVVATPIGNLRDITLRALDVLRGVDVVAAEDTRNTRNLLQHYGIAAHLVALHEHNEAVAGERLVEEMQAGKSVALVSDAGTPAVSDPGALLVAKARAAGVRVEPVPGPNAAVTALSAAGLAAPHFLFYGFLPAKAAARRRELERLKSLDCILVFYEAPHRVEECVDDLAHVLGGGRLITFARELTKLFESIHGCRLEAARTWLAEDANRRRGEFVLLVEGAAPAAEEELPESARRTLKVLLEELPVKQAAKLAAELTGAKKNALYDLALSWKQADAPR